MSVINNRQIAKYTCSSCRRGYQRKIYYSRHVAICELISKSVKERQLENEETDDTPNLRALYDVVLELANKMSHMEQKINELTKWTDLKKKSINMIEWLNENHKEGNYLCLEEFIDHIKVERNNLNYLFQTDYVSGIMKVLQDLLPLNESVINPIKAFDNKVNVLFAYCINTENNSKSWNVLSDTLLQQLINIIVKQLLNEFVKWQKENTHKMDQDDFAITYATNAKKIMGGNLTREQVYSRVKIELFKYLKINIKNITEYQFA